MATVANAQTVVFSDNFDDGDVSDWTKATNYGASTAVTVRSDAFVSPGFALWTYLDAPPGGSNLFVTANRSFIAPSAGSYTLSFSAMSVACDVCKITYEAFIDGTRIASGESPTIFHFESVVIPFLSAGAHTIGLGVATDIAFLGRFNATFDDVAITTPVPELETYAMLLAGLGLLGFAARRRKLKEAATA
jgi:hypothetical protein